MRTYDFTPLWRSTIGFDRFFDLVDAAQQEGNDDTPWRRGVIGSRSAPIARRHSHLTPVFGAAIAIAFRGERVFHVVGFTLALAGVFMASRKPAEAKASEC